MPGPVMQIDNRAQGLGLQRHLMGGGIADRQTDDEAFPAGPAHLFDQLAGKAGAVFKAATPAVRALVGPRGPELVQQRMIGGPDLDPLEAGRRAYRGYLSGGG